MALNASLDAALKGAAPLVCCLLKVVLPTRTLLLVDGAAQVVFGGETYNGEDAVYGVLNSIEPFSEQAATEAPRVRFTFLPKTLPALAEITAPNMQGSAVSLWFGAIDPASGLLIGTPELLFKGELDAAEFEGDSNATVITFDVASAWERLFEAGEGQRLNNTFLQWAYGARGFEFVTQIQRDEPWGYDAPRPRVVADTIGGHPGQPGGSPGGGWGGGGGGGGGFIERDSFAW